MKYRSMINPHEGRTNRKSPPSALKAEGWDYIARWRLSGGASRSELISTPVRSQNYS